MAVTVNRGGVTLFSDPRCHRSHRVRLVLAEKGVAAEVVSVEPRNLPEVLFEWNPHGTLPTLVDRELALHEPRVVLEYLDERYPHPPLLPAHPVARALAREAMARIERDWDASLDALAAGAEGEEGQQARARLAQELVLLAGLLAERPYLLGEDFSLVDCYLAPVLWRMRALAVPLPTSRQGRPLLEYMVRLFERPAFGASLSAAERELG
ncbi:MAG: stringent starvation protein A [Porticoccaceae bacterium]|nr:MAG: stringent starvation protein A [Porticoccaceae bacterium]